MRILALAAPPLISLLNMKYCSSSAVTPTLQDREENPWCPSSVNCPGTFLADWYLKVRRKAKDYKILGYEETTSLVSLADNLLKF